MRAGPTCNSRGEPCEIPGYRYRRGPRVTLANTLQNVRYAVRWHKPKLMVRLVGRTLLGAVARSPVVRQAELALAYDCNLDCPHCSRSRLIRDGERILELEEYERLYRELHELGLVAFVFTGGEPLHFMERLLDVIRIFHPQENLITVQSNATLLSDERARRLREAGVDMIQSSLDTFHLGSRQQINFAKAQRKLDLVRRHGMRMSYVTVVTHENIRSQSIRDVIEFTRRNRTVLLLNVPVPVGSWSGNAEVGLTREDQIYLRELTLRHVHTRLDFAANFGGFGCPAFKERLYVTPYGDVLGCPFIQVSCGSIRDGSRVGELRERALLSGYFDHYHKTCLAGEDAGFMAAYLPAHDAAGQLPLDFRQLAGPDGRLQGGPPTG